MTIIKIDHPQRTDYLVHWDRKNRLSTIINIVTLDIFYYAQFHSFSQKVLTFRFLYDLQQL